MYSTYSTYSVPILISWDIYVTTIVRTNKMKLYRPARYPEAEKLEAILKPSLSRAFLAPDILKAYQPTTLGNWQQCHILIIYAMNPPISFSPPNFFFLFLHCCSSYVHSCLTVIFTSVMPVLVTLFRPLDTALHPSSMNLQVQTRWYWRWRRLPNLHFRISLIIQHKLSPSHIPPPHPYPSPKMPDKVLSSFLVAEVLFVATGGLIIGIVLVTKEHGHHSRTTADVASNLLLMQTPLSGIWIRGKRVENA